jgi:hypothetical protein
MSSDAGSELKSRGYAVRSPAPGGTLRMHLIKCSYPFNFIELYSGNDVDYAPCAPFDPIQPAQSSG